MERIPAILRNEESPRFPNTVRFVCLSDTHTRTRHLRVPSGDVLLHTGDFSLDGSPDQVLAFSQFLASLSFTHKIVIAGNHDITFDTEHYEEMKERFGIENGGESNETKALLTGCTYLEDSGVTVEGYHIWGSPWTPSPFDWAFNLHSPPVIQAKWSLIPADTDILLTHSPPREVLDRCCDGTHAGCRELRTRVGEVRPLVHVFGHVHEAYGTVEVDNTLFVNAAICNHRHKAVNRPVIFDLPVRPV